MNYALFESNRGGGPVASRYLSHYTMQTLFLGLTPRLSLATHTL
jgi:hypothetical protein